MIWIIVILGVACFLLIGALLSARCTATKYRKELESGIFGQHPTPWHLHSQGGTACIYDFNWGIVIHDTKDVNVDHLEQFVATANKLGATNPLQESKII